MYSIQFPDMLSNQRTNLSVDHVATFQNLKYLLLSDKMSLLGDPYYGTNLKRLLYTQSTTLKDILIDDIYNSIVVFMPQIKVSRNDIDIKIKNNNIYVTLVCTNIIDHVNNLYEICLTSTEE